MTKQQPSSSAHTPAEPQIGKGIALLIVGGLLVVCGVLQVVFAVAGTGTYLPFQGSAADQIMCSTGSFVIGSSALNRGVRRIRLVRSTRQNRLTVRVMLGHPEK